MEQFRLIVALLIAQIIFAAFSYLPRVLCESEADRYRNVKWTQERFTMSVSHVVFGVIGIVMGVYCIHIAPLGKGGEWPFLALGGVCLLVGVYLFYWFFSTYVNIDGDKVVFNNESRCGGFQMGDIVRLGTNWLRIEISLKDGSTINLPIRLKNCGKLLAILRSGSKLFQQDTPASGEI